MVLEDSAGGLAREVLSRRAASRHDPDVKRPGQASGDGRGMTIRDAADVEKWAHGRIAELEHEEAWVLAIDRSHRLLRAQRAETGSVGLTHLDTARVVQLASNPRGAGFILVHNHPSDIPKPGKADIDATQEVERLARERGLRMLDSVIVCRTTHSSLLELGLMPGGPRRAPRRPHDDT
jgi:DNA repair protein RadC